MPGPIGTGAFWTGIVDWVTGMSTEDATAEIQAAWDALDTGGGN
jgi:alpha-glucoside transport system substrate-binding protein